MTVLSPEIIAAQESLTDEILSVPGVVGTAIGESDGRLCLKVMVAARSQELLQKIPSRYRGYKVILQETGVIRKRGPT